MERINQSSSRWIQFKRTTITKHFVHYESHYFKRILSSSNEYEFIYIYCIQSLEDALTKSYYKATVQVNINKTNFNFLRIIYIIYMLYM